jgi:uncharacterized membrane protein YdjX (TVP38/TMEM64 family)
LGKPEGMVYPEMDDTAAKNRRKLLVKLALAGIAGLAVGIALLAGLDLWALAKQGLDLIKQAGPVAFFSAMAILPALGAPVLAFLLTVGPAYGERFGMPLVIALSLAATTFNLILAYCLSRWALRPLLQPLIVRLGYKMPETEGSDATDLLIILRMTPGVPFCVQNYMAGLAGIPFVRYLAISCVITWANNSAFIVFGDALMNGKVKIILFAVGVIIALAAGTHMVRRHYAGKRPRA